MYRVSHARFASRTAAPALLALFVASLSVLPYFGGTRRAPADPPARDDRRPAEPDGAREALVALPMLFESNEGQADPDVRFISRGDNYTLSLTSDAALLALDGRGGVLSMRPLNARRGAAVRGGERAPGRVNYFMGRGPAGRVTNVPVFESVVYGEVYPGIDLVYYGNGRQLEYDFRLAPGANPAVVEMSFGGADGLEVSEGGDLIIHAAGSRLVQKRPHIYQEVGGGARVEVAGRYVRRGESSVGFEVGHYDANRPLVIDPVLSHATYGVSAADIKFDAAGNLYMIGGPRGAAGGGAAAGRDIVVSKFTPSADGGLSLAYTTHFGGGGFDGGGVAVDRSGNVYVAGVTNSTDFPVTPDALQPKLNRGATDTSDAGACCRDTPPQDAFIARLGPAGELLYASYFGGSGMDSATGPLVDAAGNLYLVGEAGPASNNFPVTADAYMPTRPAPADDPRDDRLFDSNAKKYDLYVAKLSPRGNGLDLAYSTYFGGNRADRLNAATVDAAGNVYLTGATGSTDFPVTANAVRSTIFTTPGAVSASTPVTLFVTKFRPSAGPAAVPYSTFVAGAVLRPRDIAVDDAGRVYLLSRDLDGDNCNRQSPENVALCDSVPVTAGAMQGSRVGGGDVVLMKLDPSAPPRRSSLVYSTYFGGTAEDDAFDMELDGAGNVYLAGRTFSTDFPVTPGVFQTAFGGGPTNDLSAPGGDGFLAKIDSAGSSLVYFTYLGGGGGDSAQLVRRDVRGNLYVAGWTLSGDFPVTDGSAANGANTFSSFLAKVSPDAVASEARVPLDAARARDPLGDATKFVRQHYLDFLSREPDARGLAHWTGEINGCGADAQCAEVKRVNVSAAFFLSIEFQRTGYLVYRVYKAAYGRVPLYEEFSPDARAISAGVAVGSPGWEGQVEANERSFLDSFAARPQFRQLYDGLSDGQYVDALFAGAGVTPTASERESLIAGLGDGSVTRAGALGQVANGEAFTRREKSRAFVLMQYFGYLRRNPDEAGFNYWLGKLNEHGGNYVEAESVKAFLDSVEYHDRFKTVPRLGT